VIRTLIVDDEPPARAKLRGLLARHDDIEIAGEACDGLEAVEIIAATAPDLVLLDIQMPRLDGFGVIETIGVDAMPKVIFVTAYDEHALRAFEVHAVDYLLKPYAADRLAAALNRIRARHPTPDEIAAVLDDVDPPPLERLMVEAGPNHHQLVAVNDVILFQSERNDIRVVTATGRFRRRGVLSRLEQRLDPARFMRVNRSEIVRLDAVAEVQPWFHGDGKLILTTGDTLTWSRRYRARDKHRFEV
jgi:two-component system LytT family response regulator